MVEFQLTGAGSLKAVGNGNAATTESFQDPFRKAFSGKCLVIVQSGLAAGDIKIKATSKGLKTATIVIETELIPNQKI